MTTNPSPTHRTQPTSARPSARQRGAQRITQATAAIGGIAVAVTGAAIALAASTSAVCTSPSASL